ncbi:hypothetical protein PV417_25420 [Streptomyces sp. ME19-03-3]|nr:hypothetical protein [Streptomyces sp. ME19-03-3]
MTKAQAHDDPDAVAAQRERIRELEKEVAELRQADGILNARPLPRGTRPEPAALRRVADAHRQFGAKAICRTLPRADTPASASHYAAERRLPTPRSARDTELTEEIRHIRQADYADNRGKDGRHAGLVTISLRTPGP